MKRTQTKLPIIMMALAMIFFLTAMTNTAQAFKWDRDGNDRHHRPGPFPSIGNSPALNPTVQTLPEGGTVFVSGNKRAKIHTYVSPDNLVTTHIIESRNSLVIIDTQDEEPWATEARDYIDSLDKDIDRVILSHSHPDHTGGLRLALYDIDLVYATSETAAALAADMFGVGTVEVNNLIEPGEYRIDGIRYEFLQFDNAEDGDQLVVVLPDLDTIIVQDLAFNGFHLFLGNAGPENASLDNWIDILQTLLATQPQSKVLVGHGRPTDKGVLTENITYLKTAIKVRARSVDFDEYRDTMIEKFLHLDGEYIFFYGNFGFTVPFPSE